MPNPIIDVHELYTEIEGHVIHRDLNFSVQEGEIIAIVGGSGSGKSTLLNCLLMLLPPAHGSIRLFGEDVTHLNPKAQEQIRIHCGILYQGGALFSELTVLQNVLFPMQEHSQLSASLLEQLALLKIQMAGLSIADASKTPAELSGGMIKRAAMARALALDPQILFLDEPSAGLDPINASALDQLILELRASLKLTIILVTHDLDTLATVPDRIAFLGNGRILACEPLKAILNSPIPEIADYFHSARAKRTFLGR